MEEKTFLTVDEVAELLSVSKSKAYEIVRQLNKELKAKGLITVAARVSKVLSGKLNDAPSGRLFRADFRTLQMCQSL